MDLIRHAMKELGVSQQLLSFHMQTSRNKIQRWVEGYSYTPKQEDIGRLKEILKAIANKKIQDLVKLEDKL